MKQQGKMPTVVIAIGGKPKGGSPMPMMKGGGKKPPAKAAPAGGGGPQKGKMPPWLAKGKK